MNFLIRLWAFLDGKKTRIAAVIMFAAIFLTEVVGGIWHISFPYMAEIISTLNWIGMALGATGLTHKMVK